MGEGDDDFAIRKDAKIKVSKEKSERRVSASMVRSASHDVRRGAGEAG